MLALKQNVRHINIDYCLLFTALLLLASAVASPAATAPSVVSGVPTPVAQVAAGLQGKGTEHIFIVGCLIINRCTFFFLQMRLLFELLLLLLLELFLLLLVLMQRQRVKLLREDVGRAELMCFQKSKTVRAVKVEIMQALRNWELRA